jgi:hypothetical protein
MPDLMEDGRFKALTRRLDDLISEAVRIRTEISASVRYAREFPFYPDRRRNTETVDEERRGTAGVVPLVVKRRAVAENAMLEITDSAPVDYRCRVACQRH